jgi:hypothetical protein
MGDKVGIAWSLGQLGRVAMEVGDCAQARVVNEERLQIEQEMGNQQGIGATLVDLAMVVLGEGRYSYAMTLMEEATPFLRPVSRPRLLNVQGDTARQAGDTPRAKAYYEQALRLAQEIGNTRDRAWACSNLGTGAGHCRGAYDRRVIADRQVRSSYCQPYVILRSCHVHQ